MVLLRVQCVAGVVCYSHLQLLIRQLDQRDVVRVEELLVEPAGAVLESGWAFSSGSLLGCRAVSGQVTFRGARLCAWT